MKEMNSSDTNAPDTNASEKVQLARHKDRPYSMDIFRSMFSGFVELHGDRRYADDAAVVSGFARLDDVEVAVIGHQKGRDMKQRRYRNFGMPKPEGYRKALRIMKLAEKFSRPVITFVDTPGAYPGIDAEERGQAEAIAYNLREMAMLKVPVVIVILGEGGSGGALAIGIGDRVLMLENAVYSVISPEGCAAILWKDASQSERAANSLRLTAEDLLEFGIVDTVIPETAPWKFADSPEEFEGDPIVKALKTELTGTLRKLSDLEHSVRLEKRFRKLRETGRWITI